MLINYRVVRLVVIFILVIIFPLVQKQWLNLYLYDINNFSIYQFLYFSSGLLFPIFICINSINNFTSYKFSNNNIKEYYINGRKLFLIVFTALFIFSTLIFNYIIFNFNILLKIINNNNNYFYEIDLEKNSNSLKLI